ncbi:uncharacterized protein LOC115447730 [Manduca sexta]|uniref:uncharacterized protein LOC115447730 n=1 Tax=Manduca sexta TaxID=7130 RepID=UPI00188F7AC5|nr:uncharacterized protein LOC115447730 [Manduca sexta]
MVLQFEGAVNNISEVQLAFIREVLEKRGYKDTKVTIEAVGKAGDNYVANVKRIIVKNENGEFRIIAKVASQQEHLRITAGVQQSFRNEHIMYTLVLPKYQQFEEQAGLHNDDRLRFAECYGSFTEPPHEVILLEDLQVAGFSMLDRFTPLSDKCIRSMLRNLAILHSLSFALKYKEPETYNECKNNLIDTLVIDEKRPDIQYFWSYLENNAVNVVEGDVRKKHVNKCVSYNMEQSSKISKEIAGSKQSVIQQGDVWTNNILFKFHGDSVESVMIDYQMTKENNPTNDLMLTIFGCSDQETQVKHFNDWLDYYHTELDQKLHDLGLKANFVYPRDQLDADMKRYAKSSLGALVVAVTFSLMQPSNAEKVKDSTEEQFKPVKEEEKEAAVKDFFRFDGQHKEMYKKRLEGIVDNFIKFGLL